MTCKHTTLILLMKNLFNAKECVNNFFTHSFSHSSIFYELISLELNFGINIQSIKGCKVILRSLGTTDQLHASVLL